MRRSEELLYSWVQRAEQSVNLTQQPFLLSRYLDKDTYRLNDCFSDRTGRRSVTYNKNKPAETLCDCWNDYTAGTAGEAYVDAFFLYSGKNQLY